MTLKCVCLGRPKVMISINLDSIYPISKFKIFKGSNHIWHDGNLGHVTDLLLLISLQKRAAHEILQFLITYVDVEYLMLHTKLQDNRTFGS